MDVEIIGDDPEEVADRLNRLQYVGRQGVNNGLMSSAVDIKKEIERTSPVDTREYQNSWYIKPVAEDEVWILNRADHAKFLVLPNSNFIGSSGADIPTQGIYHNIKGIAKGEQSGLVSAIQDQIMQLLRIEL